MATPTSTPSIDGPFSFVERNWSGMNSDSPRQALGEGEFSWLENMLPLAPGTLAVVPAKSLVYTLSGDTIKSFDSVTVAGVPYLIAATASGDVYAWEVGVWTRITVKTGLSTSGITFAAFINEYLLILDPAGTLYYWDGSTTTAVASPPWLTTVQCIAVWNGRVWVAQGLTVFYSAPNSVTDFTTANGGGSLIVSDEYLEGEVVAMVPSQDYLYVAGNGAVLLFSNLQLLSGNVTYFQVTRVSQTSGVLSVGGATPYQQAMLTLNAHGMEAFSGVTAQSLNGNMNLFFSNVDYTKTVSVAVGTVYNKLVFLGLVYYTPESAWYLACFMEGRWFLANMGTLSLLAWIAVNSAPAAFATDGTHIYELFEDTSTNVSFKAETGFYDGGDPTKYKQLLKVGVEVNVPATSGSSVSFTADTEKSSDPSQSFTLTSGYNWLRKQSSQTGQYLGMTVSGSLPAGTIEGWMIQYKGSAVWP